MYSFSCCEKPLKDQGSNRSLKGEKFESGWSLFWWCWIWKWPLNLYYLTWRSYHIKSYCSFDIKLFQIKKTIYKTKFHHSVSKSMKLCQLTLHHYSKSHCIKVFHFKLNHTKSNNIISFQSTLNHIISNEIAWNHFIKCIAKLYCK